MSQITNVITLKTYAAKHGLDAKRIRRLARNGDWPDDGNAPFKFGDTNGRGGVWAINADAPAVVLPPKSQRGSRRTDGRQRHIVYANTAEMAAVVDIVGIDNVIDPRVASKLRRDARKLAELSILTDGDMVDRADAERAADDKSEYFDAVGDVYAAHDAELDPDAEYVKMRRVMDNG